MKKNLFLAAASLVLVTGVGMVACQSSSSDGSSDATGPGAGGDGSVAGSNGEGGSSAEGGNATGGTGTTGGTGDTAGGTTAAGGTTNGGSGGTATATGGNANGGNSAGGDTNGGSGGSSAGAGGSSAGASGSGGATTCKEDKLHPGKAGMPSLYCPFAVGSGGTSTAVYCDAPTEHCCETAANTVPAACEPAATACPAQATDWGCFDPSTDCATGQVCCVSGMEAVTNNVDTTCMAQFPNNHYLGGKVTGSACAASCTSMQLQICESDDQCPSGMTCLPTTSKGAQFGVCGT